MPKVPIFRLRTSEPPSRPDLQYYGPTLAFADLRLGVDNLRYDVFLSPRITADLSFYLARYIARIGEVESLFAPNASSSAPAKFIRASEAAKLAKSGRSEERRVGKE